MLRVKDKTLRQTDRQASSKAGWEIYVFKIGTDGCYSSIFWQSSHVQEEIS